MNSRLSLTSRYAPLALVCCFLLTLPSSLSAQETANNRYEKKLNSYLSEYARILNSKIDCPYRLKLFTNENTYKKTTGADPSNIAFSLRGRVYLLASPQIKKQLWQRALRHEAVHLALSCLAKRSIPAWLEEGLAVHFEGNSGKYLKYYSKHKDTLKLIDLNNSLSSFKEEKQQLAYAKSSFAAKILLNTFGYSKIKELLTVLAEGMDFSQAFEQVYAISIDAFDSSLLRQKKRLNNK